MRGPIISSFSIALDTGELTVYVAGAWLNRKTLSLVLLTIPLGFLLIGSFKLPNSPVYLVKNNQEFRAKRVLHLLGETNVDERLMEIKQGINDEKNNSNRIVNSLSKPEAKVSLYLGSLLIFCDVAYSPIVSFESYVFEESGLNVNLFIVVSAVIPIVFASLIVLVVKYLGKRITLMLSLVVVFSSLLGIAIYHTLQCLNVDVKEYRLLPSVLIIVYETGSSCAGSMASCYTSEIFPYDMKVAANFYCTATSALVNATVIKFHEVQ